MKTKVSKRKVRNKILWALTVHVDGKRHRKFFDTYAEAKGCDVMEWLGGKAKTQPAGDDTILSVALEKYLLAYQKRNENSAKPRQKGYDTTADRVNKFVQWYGPDRRVAEVTTKDWVDYVESGNWSHKTKLGYGGAVKIFLAWCGEEGYGQVKENWYSTVNKGLAVKETKKRFHKLPGICSVEETKALLDTIHQKYRPAMAIMFFTGIRAEMEMTMLRYSDIQWGKRIGLEAERTKTGRERWIVPPENLWEWFPKRGKGLVNPVSFNAFTQARALAARRAFGWVDKEPKPRKGRHSKSYVREADRAFREKPPIAGYKPEDVHGFTYPSNGARHSFGSYGYWRDFEWALDVMGHMSSETFLSNYKNNRVDKTDSEEYFSIVP